MQAAMTATLPGVKRRRRSKGFNMILRLNAEKAQIVSLVPSGSLTGSAGCCPVCFLLVPPDRWRRQTGSRCRDVHGGLRPSPQDRMSSRPVSSAHVGEERAHGSCINEQHGDPRFSPRRAACGDPATGAAPLRQSPLNKYETAPLCVTVFYIQQGSRERGGTFFAHLQAKKVGGPRGRSEDVSHYSCAI